MSDLSHFDTSILGTSGIWPATPDWWSFSSLRQASMCPRKWGLSRATYPGVWTRSGYPLQPSLPALLGDVVHRSIELAVRAAKDPDVAGEGSERLVHALRKLGGLSALVHRCVDERLDQLGENPRALPRLASIETFLRNSVPNMRQRTQSQLARFSSQLEVSDDSASHLLGVRSQERWPVTQGMHSELEVRASALRMVGKIDLVGVDSTGCEITDFKTGAPQEYHRKQVQTYALLWQEDFEVNPAHIPTRALRLSYSEFAESVPVPDTQTMAALRDELILEVEAADVSVARHPPDAHPSADNCAYCSVRHLCDDYWVQVVVEPSLVANRELFDCQICLAQQNGSTSWRGVTQGGEDLLLRLQSRPHALSVGDTVRALGLIRLVDPESETAIAHETSGTELFAVASPSPK